MSYFPICVDLSSGPVLLVGSGPQIREKVQRLTPMGAELRLLDTLEESDLDCRPVMVILGGLDLDEARAYSRLCRERNIPVNVVDVPELCSFYFPSLISRGDLTVGITTGGKSPGFAACLRQLLEEVIPQSSGEIIDQLFSLRSELRLTYPPQEARKALMACARRCLSLGRPMDPNELGDAISSVLKNS